MYPKTEEERQTTHYARYGTTSLPPRGTGVQRAGLTTGMSNSTVFILGMLTGGFLAYFIMQPGKTVGKGKEVYAAFRK